MLTSFARLNRSVRLRNLLVAETFLIVWLNDVGHLAAETVKINLISVSVEIENYKEDKPCLQIPVVPPFETVSASPFPGLTQSVLCPKTSDSKSLSESDARPPFRAWRLTVSTRTKLLQGDAT